MTTDEALNRIKQMLGDDGFLLAHGDDFAVGTRVDGRRWTFGVRATPAEAVALVERIAGPITVASVPN